MNVRLHLGVRAESLLNRSPIGSDPEYSDVPNAREELPPVHHNPSHIYTHYGLPYQDHNYVAPPPPTPPASPPPTSAPPIKVNGHIDIEHVTSNTEVTTSGLAASGGDVTIYTPDDSVTRCACDFEHDDGYMICCDMCSVWQHIVCMGIDKNNIPDKYLCEKCEPRMVDKQKARDIQVKKREELAQILYAIDSSATETEDETIRLGINPSRDRQKKSKGKKKKEREKATKANAKKAKKLKKDKKLKEKGIAAFQKKKRSKFLSPKRLSSASDSGVALSKSNVSAMTTDATPIKSDLPGATPMTGKRPHRKNSLKSPKSPVKSSIKSPIVKALRARSPLRIPKSPVKSPPSSPVKTPEKSPVKSPVKTPPKVPAKSPPGKSIATLSLNENENALDSWGSHLPEGYELARTNQYTPDIMQILSSKKLNGQHPESADSKASPQLLAQLCKVAQVDKASKGLEATEDLKSDCPVIEYTGRVMLREQYDKENIFFRLLQPFVLFYSDFEDLDLCVNAESYGNDARYIRRSCTPNAKLQHMVQNGTVLFIIHSQKNINKGAEITIPFDFDYQESNYDVECACSRASCPVVKFYQKREENKVTKKKRSARLNQREKRMSMSADNNQDEGSNISVGTVSKGPSIPPPANQEPAKPAGPPPKRRRLTSTSEKPKEEPRELRRKSTSNLLSKEEEKPEDPKPPSNPLSPGASNADSEDENARLKKMTREERKMDAIMKAFEKLEKREERRKEALARLEHVGKKPEKPEKETPPKEVKEPPKQVKEEVTEETLKPAPSNTDTKPKIKTKKKAKHVSTSRRTSRVNSGASSTNEPVSSADESSNQMGPQTPASAPPTVGKSNHTSISTPSTPSTGPPGRSFRFPKTKKHMMNEWLSEKAQDLQKPLTIKTEALETHDSSITPDRSSSTSDFVKCVPSPHATPLSHLRRSSFSGSQSQKTFNTPSPVQLDCNLGSAKKRWLRQAMFESNTSQPGGAQPSPSGSMSPLPNGGMSPNPYSCTNSPGASPQVSHSIADFVTPLKKRRLARESVGLETPPYLPTPSTPLPASGDVLIHDVYRDEPSSYSALKMEDTDTATRGLNGFRTHLQHPVPGMVSSRILEGLGGEANHRASPSEALVSHQPALVRSRHESGHSDYSRSELDTDTEDSRPDDVFRSRVGSDSVGSTRGLEMLTELALQAERQRTESRSSQPSLPKPTPDTGYKIELKPESSALPPRKFFPALSRSPPQELVNSSAMVKTGLEHEVLQQCEKPVDDNVESDIKPDTMAGLQPDSKQSEVLVSKDSDLADLTDDCKVKEFVYSEIDTSQGASNGPPAGPENVNNHYVGSDLPHPLQTIGSEHTDIVESIENTTNVGSDSARPLQTIGSEHIFSDKVKSIENRSQTQNEMREDSERLNTEALASTELETKRVEVGSSTSGDAVQRHCGEVSIPDPSSQTDSPPASHIRGSEATGSQEMVTNSDMTVSSHLICDEPLPSSSTIRPSDVLSSDYLNSSNEVLYSQGNGTHLVHYASPPSQKDEDDDGEVSSLASLELTSLHSESNKEDLLKLTRENNADSSIEGSTSHLPETAKLSAGPENLVSCSSDAPTCGEGEGVMASTSVHRGAEDSELEEGECVSETDESDREEEGVEVTSMETSSSPQVQAEVSSSKRVEENMEVDQPDQSSLGRSSVSEQCHEVSTRHQLVSLPSASSSGGQGETPLVSTSNHSTESPFSSAHRNDEDIDSTSGCADSNHSSVQMDSHESRLNAVCDVSSSSTYREPRSLYYRISASNTSEPCPSTSGYKDNGVSEAEASSAGVLLTPDSARRDNVFSPANSNNISSSSSPPVVPGLRPHSGSFSSSHSLSSSSSSPSISPTGIAPTSTSISPAQLHARKRVSLLEYRKRMKQKGPSSLPTSSSSCSSSTSSSSHSPLPSSSTRPRPRPRDPRALHPSATSSTRDQNDSPTPTLAPLPLFNKPSSGRDKHLHGRSQSEEDEVDSRWNTAATSVERVREQTLSLTERLRREFGVDAADESSEDDERAKVSSDGNSSSYLPPPPPPHIGDPHPRTLPLHSPIHPPPPTQQQQQQVPTSNSSIPSLMSIPSYTTKHYRDKRLAGASSNFSYPATAPHGSQYPASSQAPSQAPSQFNNITVTPNQASQQQFPPRGGGTAKPHYGSKLRPLHSQQPPPSTATTPPPPPPPSGAYAAAYTAVPSASAHTQYTSGALPPPPPRFGQGPHPAQVQHPSPGSHNKIIRDYHHKH